MSDRIEDRFEMVATTVGDSILLETTSVIDGLRNKISKQVLDTGDELVRQALIRMGWIPPRREGYYIASFGHRNYNNECAWWMPNNAGYTNDLMQAGVYEDFIPGYHDRDDNVPVPVAFMKNRRIRHTVDTGDTGNHVFWSVDKLRASILSWEAAQAVDRG